MEIIDKYVYELNLDVDSKHLDKINWIYSIQGTSLLDNIPLNLFIYQARESSLVPGPRVSDCPVSEENIIYEASVLIGELGWSFSSMLYWRKGSV